MLELFSGSVLSETFTLQSLIICTVFSLLFGCLVAMVYMFKNKYSGSLATTLVLLPAMVQIVIMLTSGNIGVGIAVAGAFSLVRFRSIAGTAREIGALFFAMAVGFVTGLGYVFYAFVFLVIIGTASLLLTHFSFGQNSEIRVLKIKIPENLDYEGLFNEVFDKYTQSHDLVKVKTTNMGSLYELTFHIRLISEAMPKAFMDELRLRNGNLNIILGRIGDGDAL
ncbi:MAG: DUF4956 domain-containing protein [Oscillospiraceae bacterium]|nr:DUF4956 domain-containing protein [Oscillospiraceae bacterium]